MEIEQAKERIDLLNRLSHRLVIDDAKQALQLTENAFKEAEKIHYEKGLADAHQNISICHYYLSNYQISITHANKALALYYDLKDEKQQAAIFNNLGINYYRIGIYDESLRYHIKCLEIRERINDNTIVATYTNIGNVYNDLAEFEKALGYYLKALKLYQTGKNQNGESAVLANMGMVYTNLKEYDKAIACLNESIESRAITDKRRIGNILNQLGDIYTEINDFSASENYVLKALSIFTESDYIFGKMMCFYTLARLALKRGELEKSTDLATQALSIAEQLGVKASHYEIHKLLSEAYEKQGNSTKALEHYKKFHEIKDEILGQEKTNKINFLRTQTIEKEKEIERLKNIELKKAYDEIDEKNKELYQLSLVASETNNVIIILDPQGNIEWINATFSRYFGISYKQLIEFGKSTLFSVSTSENIQTIFNECVKNKLPITYESKHETPLMGVVWIHNTLSPVLDENGNIKNFIIICSDVSERKRNEDIIKEKNKDITDSINAASRIQSAIFPKQDSFPKILKNSFSIFMPKDIVSGDFYWIKESKSSILIALADCTGHGVPGAMMTILGLSLLNRIDPDPEKTSPAELLSLLDMEIRKELSQSKDDVIHTPQGMDVSMCKINKRIRQIEYAGANRPLYHISNGALKLIDGDKFSIGGYMEDDKKVFTNQVIDIEKNDAIYLTTDGLGDQFGGPNNKKFSTKRVKEFLLSVQNLKMGEQKALLLKTIEEWKGTHEQTDDISIIGIKHPDS